MIEEEMPELTFSDLKTMIEIAQKNQLELVDRIENHFYHKDKSSKILFLIMTLNIMVLDQEKVLLEMGADIDTITGIKTEMKHLMDLVSK